MWSREASSGDDAAVLGVHLDLAVDRLREQRRRRSGSARDERDAGLVARRFDSEDGRGRHAAASERLASIAGMARIVAPAKALRRRLELQPLELALGDARIRTGKSSLARVRERLVRTRCDQGSAARRPRVAFATSACHGSSWVIRFSCTAATKSGMLAPVLSTNPMLLTTAIGSDMAKTPSSASIQSQAMPIPVSAPPQIVWP